MAEESAIVVDPAGYRLPDSQRRAIRWTIYIGYAALTAGAFHGLANALDEARINILGWFPGLDTYYQGLTVHGVANALAKWAIETAERDGLRVVAACPFVQAYIKRHSRSGSGYWSSATH